jgi:hypothetical protein
MYSLQNLGVKRFGMLASGIIACNYQQELVIIPPEL